MVSRALFYFVVFRIYSVLVPRDLQTVTEEKKIGNAELI
jgi:hypothetical protein